MFRSLLRPSSGRSKRILIKYNDCPNCISKTTWCYSEYLKRYQWSLNFGLIWFYRRIKCTLLLKTNQIWCVCFYFLVDTHQGGWINMCASGEMASYILWPWVALEILTVTASGFTYADLAIVIFYLCTCSARWWWSHKRVSMCDKAYFISVHLLVCHVIVDIVPYWKKRKVCFIGGKSLVD